MTKIIETRRLILRPYALSDAPMLATNLGQDWNTARFLLPGQFPETIKKAESYIQERLPHYQDLYFYDDAVILKNTKELIGEINASHHQKTADIGFALGSRWWNQGYASEALSAWIDQLFQDGCEMIVGACEVQNAASARVMMKCGMKETEHLPAFFEAQELAGSRYFYRRRK